MKNFWALRPMIRVESYLCLDRVLDLLHCKLSSTNWIILSACMEKYGCKPSVRTSVKVKYVISLATMQIQDSGQPIAKNTALQSRKVTIALHKSKLSLHNYYTSKSSEWVSLTSRFFEQPSSLTSVKLCKIW